MNRRSQLLPIVAFARSGALDHAWRQFRAAGLESVQDDPAVLSVRGRLLKDRALAASGHARLDWYLQAADAYARAGSLNSATYPLINAATLYLLVGRRETSAPIAERVLAIIDADSDEPETPYYQAATRAEALLLLGRVAEARSALTDAVALAPRAWEDHASTLRQFGLVLDALGQSDAWLDPLRPPRALHFAGHMGIGANDTDLASRIADVLEAERVGFGYGALAAGSDLLIAEALLERGAEVHVVLSGDRDAFRAESVVRQGADWGERFDRVLERAETVQRAENGGAPTHPLAIRQAAETAMGLAVMQAQRLSTEAVQLLVLDPADAPAASASARFGETWTAAGRRRLVLESPRRSPPGDGHPAAADEVLAAHIVIQPEGADDPRLLAETILPALRIALSTAEPVGRPTWTGGAVAAAFPTPDAAATAALAAVQALGETTALRVGGDYGLTTLIADPFGEGVIAAGPAPLRAARLTASTPPGAVHVTAAFATALYAGPPPAARAEAVGELPSNDPDAAIALFSLRP